MIWYFVPQLIVLCSVMMLFFIFFIIENWNQHNNYSYLLYSLFSLRIYNNFKKIKLSIYFRETVFTRTVRFVLYTGIVHIYFLLLPLFQFVSCVTRSRGMHNILRFILVLGHSRPGHKRGKCSQCTAPSQALLPRPLWTGSPPRARKARHRAPGASRLPSARLRHQTMRNPCEDSHPLSRSSTAKRFRHASLSLLLS